MPDPAPQNGPLSREIALARPREPISAEKAAEITENISHALKRAARKSRAPVSIISGGGARERPGERMFRKGVLTSFVLLVVIPFIAASLYWGLIASKQYATEAKFALRAADSPSLAALGAVDHDDRQIQDAQVVVRYILGRSMIEALDKRLDLRGKFSRAGVDYFSRFDPDDPVETLEKYWKKRVDANVDMMSGIVSVQVRAFTPKDSLAIMEGVVDFSEKLVNELSTRARRDAVAQARAELTRAEDRLKSATASMRNARNDEGVLDAAAAADAINKVVTQLRLELVAAEESLALQSSAAAGQSPQAKFLNARVESLRKQIADYSAQIAGAERKDSLADHARALSVRQVELTVAQQRYAEAASTYESARVDLERQRAYLALFLRPTLAEKSIYPRRWLEWAIVVIPAALIWAILLGFALLTRDHMAK